MGQGLNVLGLDLRFRIFQIHSEEVSVLLHLEFEFSHHRAFVAGPKLRVSTILYKSCNTNYISYNNILKLLYKDYIYANKNKFTLETYNVFLV